MVWEIVVVGAFVALSIGRVVWEKRSNRSSQPTTQREEADWSNAIR